MIRIFLDSTSDMEPELMEKYGITVIPLYVVMGDVQKKDVYEITPQEIFEWSDANNTTPKTAAFPPQDAVVELEKAKAAGDDVVHIGISTEMSTSCNSVIKAADMIGYSDHVHVVDSRNITNTQAIMAIEAVKMREEGKSAKEIAEILRGMTDKFRLAFVVDTLTYLHRGGRCSGVAAFFGAKLKIKPCIAVKDGKMYVKKKYRGALSDVFVKLCEDCKEEMLMAASDDIYITYSIGVDDKLIAQLKSTVEGLNHFKNIHVMPTGGIISCHCGPGTLGFIYRMK